jgi:N-acyl-D-amino-acid deacylase
VAGGTNDGKIAGVSRDISDSTPARTIDAEGMTVCPGFIDTHSHDDAYLLIKPQGDGKVRQGVTTDVIGNCGFSLAPISDEHRDDFRNALAIMGGGYLPEDFWNLSSFNEFLTKLEGTELGINVVP